MKSLLIAFMLIINVDSSASDSKTLTSAQLSEQISIVNTLQNQVLMINSTRDDALKLFDQYTNDFTYIHNVYGGTYTRNQLLKNTLKYLKAGNYKNTKPRYEILSVMIGHNAVAVTRRQLNGDEHLSVFEFRGKKVSKIIEYWR